MNHAVILCFLDVGVKLENSTDFEEEELLLPPKEDLQILLDRWENRFVGQQIHPGHPKLVCKSI